MVPLTDKKADERNGFLRQFYIGRLPQGKIAAGPHFFIRISYRNYTVPHQFWTSELLALFITEAKRCKDHQRW